ncbi:hypothetical protein ACFFIY_13430 [Bhargavaea ullalensis]|uniref:Holin n=1 Tax=Bhargavaea ullalensis TaxID=1265685 RepID=A0ABV2G864_9BACL
MDEWIGKLIALGIMAVLLYSVWRQARHMVSAGCNQFENWTEVVSGTAFIVFYALSLLPAFGSETAVDWAAPAAWVSLIAYLIAKFGLKPEADHTS